MTQPDVVGVLSTGTEKFIKISLDDAEALADARVAALIILYTIRKNSKDGSEWWRARYDEISEASGVSLKRVRAGMPFLVREGLVLRDRLYQYGKSDYSLSWKYNR